MKRWTENLFAGGLLLIIFAGVEARDQFGDGWAAVTRHDSPNQIAEGQRMARDWRPK